METRELDRRQTDGVEVALLWTPARNSVSVAVMNWSTGETFEVDVDPANALDAFHHPYAYAA